MTVVCDVSAAISFLIGGTKSDAIAEILMRADRVIAPELYIAELSNVLWKYTRFQNMPPETAKDIQLNGIRLIHEFESMLPLWPFALDESIRRSHSCYDMMYLLTARRHRAVLLTLDARLNQLAIAEGIATV